MNNSFDFSTFSRQSSKGIIVNYFLIFYKSLKSSWILIPLLFTKKPENFNATKIVLGIALILIYILIRSVLLYLNYKFKVKDNGFVLKHGILKKTNVSIPFSKIQNVKFKQNFIQQLINVTEVEIETAGAKNVEVSIKALTRERAEALKEVLFSDRVIVKEEEIETLDEKKATELLKVSPLELLKVSISENHFHSFLLLFAFIFSGYAQLKDVLEDLEINNQLDVLVEENASTLVQDVFLVVILVLFAFVISIIISFVRTFLKHFNLKLSIKEKALEISQGLITKQHSIIKKEKVQYLVISTNPIKKIIGIYNVVFKQATSGKVKANKIIKIVGAKFEQISILKNVLFTEEISREEEKVVPNSYYIIQMYFRSFLFLAVLNLVALLNIYILFINLVAIPLVILLINLKYKKTFFRLHPNLLEVGSGQFSTEIIYFEIFKMQHIKLRQSIFQKRKNVADIILQTASGKIKIPCLDKNLAVELYNLMLYKTEISKKSWM
ncbi:PH domain-containing protein [Lutibacter sp.]|uniref:PH domain-containing protein n=1 Tax=Lutibacter sp. TaxID=1925666 RepID=UPI001A2BF5AB|nr:PH domain-containing protein [Lutibacter sp.]MBI9041739.1 PH domain-containing protein [Lutibacter sp.]